MARSNFRRMLIAAASLAMAMAAAPAAAELLPRPERIGAPEPLLREISEMMVARQVGGAARLARLDAILADLREPDQVRGLIQFYRAVHLRPLGRLAEARSAAEESIRLLPGYSAPLLVAADFEAFSDRPGVAADYLLRASEIDPAIVARMPSYDLRNVLSRLSGQNDLRRLGLLAERMVAINWQGDDVDLNSQLAREAIRSRISARDVAGARALVTQLIDPSDLRALLIDNRYRALWPDLETWGGVRQERQWPVYLRELQARFEASNDLLAARRYAEALRAANHYETIVKVIGPLFAGPLDRESDYELLWVATTVADALARLGRWDEIEAMFARADRTWPLGTDANALNVAGNRARFRLAAGDAAGAVAALEAVLADAEGRAGEVDSNALANMHYGRACALHEAGRDHEAVASVSRALSVRNPTLSALLHLCFDRPDAARAALVESLSNEATRDDVLSFVQPSDSPPMQSEFGRRSASRVDALRRDPALLRAVSRYGRILPHAPSAGAPPER